MKKHVSYFEKLNIMIVLIFIGLISSFNAIGQISPPDLNGEKLKGQIVSIKEDEYKAIDNFGELKKTKHI